MPIFQISTIFARFGSRDDFVEDRYSFPERRRRELARRGAWWRRHLAWIGVQPWPLRVVIVLLEIAGTCVAGLAGVVLGLFLRGLTLTFM